MVLRAKSHFLCAVAHKLIVQGDKVSYKWHIMSYTRIHPELTDEASDLK
jgi:hypothetical protein